MPTQARALDTPRDLIQHVRAIIRTPLYNHRKTLGRCWSYPQDYIDGLHIACTTCELATLHVPDDVLYVETNRIMSELALELFPNSA